MGQAIPRIAMIQVGLNFAFQKDPCDKKKTLLILNCLVAFNKKNRIPEVKLTKHHGGIYSAG